MNLTDGESHVRPLVVASALPFVALHVAGPLWIRGEGGVSFPLLRESWGYLDAQDQFVQVFRPAPVVPAAMLTVEVRAGS